MSYLLEDFKEFYYTDPHGVHRRSSWFRDGDGNHLVLNPETRSYYYYEEAMRVYTDMGFSSIVMIDPSVISTYEMKEFQDIIASFSTGVWTSFLINTPQKSRYNRGGTVALCLGFENSTDLAIIQMTMPPMIMDAMVDWKSFSLEEEIRVKRTKRKARKYI